MSKIDKIAKTGRGCLMGSAITRYSPDAVTQINCAEQWCTSCPASIDEFLRLVKEMNQCPDSNTSLTGS